jgi:hypothetical protein
VGGSWFGLGTAAPPDRPVVQLGGQPDAPPASGSGRVSYGFPAGPISPNRQIAAPLRPALPAAPTPPTGYPPFDRQSSPTVEQPPSPVTVDQRPVTTDEFEALRPRVEVRAEPPQGVEPPVAEPRRRSRLFTFGVVVLSAIVLVGGSLVGVVYFDGDGGGKAGGTLDASIQPGVGDAGKRTVTAPLSNRTKAAFELLAGADVVHLSIKDLGDDLYRISTPDDAGIRPSPQVRDDDVKLQVAGEATDGRGQIDVVLAAKVQWSLRFSGYAQEQRLDLSGGRVSGLEMVAGTGKATVTLARASGTVPVKINGAVNELVLRSPSDSPVRVRVDGGAKTVVAGSRALQDVAAGSTLTPRNWATRNRYDVAVGARITSLTVANA